MKNDYPGDPSLADLRPGDIMFGPIGGIVPGWFPVAVGQFLLADRKARLGWRTWRRVRHVGVVVEAGHWRPRGDDEWIGPRLVQAMPHGAEEIELTAARHWTSDYIYIRPTYVEWRSQGGKSPYRPGLATDLVEAARGCFVAEAARGYLGTPYNFLTYGALAARKLRFVLGDRLLCRWISSRKDMMCSQLADQALADAGYHVFDDGRLPQDVVPAELYRALLERPGRWIRPGASGGWRRNGLTS